MSARLLSFVIWAAVAASVAMWASRLVDQATPVPAHAEVVGPAPVPTASLVRLFGSPPVLPVPAQAAPAPVVQTQFKLIGVVAPRPGERNGLALIAADERPARAVPVGGRVDESLVVLSINHRQVDLGPKGGPVTLSLNLPAVAEAARGAPPGVAQRTPGGVPGAPFAGAPGLMSPGRTPPTLPPQIVPTQPALPQPQLPQTLPVVPQGEMPRPGSPQS